MDTKLLVITDEAGLMFHIKDIQRFPKEILVRNGNIICLIWDYQEIVGFGIAGQIVEGGM